MLRPSDNHKEKLVFWKSSQLTTSIISCLSKLSQISDIIENQMDPVSCLKDCVIKINSKIVAMIKSILRWVSHSFSSHGNSCEAVSILDTG